MSLIFIYMFHASWLVFSSFLIIHLGWQKLVPLEGGQQKQGAADLTRGEMDLRIGGGI